ncbi:hypothetical protein IF1G_01361 [Cordyceps javanica]|uniref:Uncharacterized protein n=1 Tax=Cordyceps javanica TaxID=43265 RepID=A0A545VBN8_9HYPO|nr:hypothetical protein IF1G_01361 [Cordyceps javanica]
MADIEGELRRSNYAWIQGADYIITDGRSGLTLPALATTSNTWRRIIGQAVARLEISKSR